VVLWLLGRGLGWFGGAPDAPRTPGAAVAVVPAPALEIRAGSAAPARVGPPASARPISAPPAPSKAGGEGPRILSRAPAPARAIEPDRFASLASLYGMHLSRGDLAAADALLARMRAQVDDGAQAEQIEAMRSDVTAARAAAEAALLAHLQEGEVLAADEVAERLGQGAAWAPAAAALRAIELGEDWLRPALRAQVERLPDLPQLARQRQVRLQWQDGWQIGAVVRARGDRTTVRLVGDAGQRFPTVATVALEPVDTDAAEAAAMAVVAARSGAPRLARLWLARACLLGEAPAALVAQLRAALQ
jgi:hypothetical protein